MKPPNEALFWTPEATQDHEEIYDYSEGDNPAALALDELFSDKAARLTDHPHLSRPGHVAGTLELIAQRNYILVYDLAGDVARVLRVLHAARPMAAAEMIIVRQAVAGRDVNRLT